ncbi:MAG: hypothetical protein ACYDG2_21320 [Ruminiclostridium sp.]
MAHVNGYIRDTFEKAFFCEYNDARLNFDSSSEEMYVIGKLWNCTDIVSRGLREEVIKWVRQQFKSKSIPNDVAKKCDEYHKGCNYSQLVRLMKPLLQLKNKSVDN